MNGGGEGRGKVDKYKQEKLFIWLINGQMVRGGKVHYDFPTSENIDFQIASQENTKII